MSVYVDKPVAQFGRMVMCHMLADSLDELHEMADKIDLPRKYFQKDVKTPHYDLCKSKRKLAVLHGAIEVSRRELGQIIRSMRIMR